MKEGLSRGLVAVAVLGLVAFVLGGTFGVSHPVSADALMASASLAMFLVAILAALGAIVGWRTLTDHVQARIDSRIEEVKTGLRQELTGSLRIAVGNLYGRMCRQETATDIVITSTDFLQKARHETRSALHYLKGTDKEWIAKNNLAFYLALDYEAGCAQEAVNLALQLSSYYSTHVEVQTTCAKVVATYHSHYQDPRKELLRAEQLMAAVTTNTHATHAQRASANRHLASIRSALTTASAPDCPP